MNPFSLTLDALALDPDHDIPARPYVEIQTTNHRSRPLTQYYYSEHDNGWPVGQILFHLPDEKEPLLQWRITKRWFYIPAFGISVCIDQGLENAEIMPKCQCPRLSGAGPYIAVARKFIWDLIQEQKNRAKETEKNQDKEKDNPEDDQEDALSALAAWK